MHFKLSIRLIENDFWESENRNGLAYDSIKTCYELVCLRFLRASSKKLVHSFIFSPRKLLQYKCDIEHASNRIITLPIVKLRIKLRKNRNYWFFRRHLLIIINNSNSLRCGPARLKMLQVVTSEIPANKNNKNRIIFLGFEPFTECYNLKF